MLASHLVNTWSMDYRKLTQNTYRLDVSAFLVRWRSTTWRRMHDFYPDESIAQWTPYAFQAMLVYSFWKRKKNVWKEEDVDVFWGLNLLSINAWAFIDDHDSVFVSKLHRFLWIWIMWRAIRVCTDPFDQIEIFRQQRHVETFTTNLKIRIINSWNSWNEELLFKSIN